MKIRSASRLQILHIDIAIAHLRRARDSLKIADCPKTLARVRLALASAGGAERHVRHHAIKSRRSA